jgi:hypothetical protein
MKLTKEDLAVGTIKAMAIYGLLLIIVFVLANTSGWSQ